MRASVENRMLGRVIRELLLFDAAGTLIETAEPVERVYARVLSNHGMTARPEDLRRAFRETFSVIADPDFATHAEGDAAERRWWEEVVRRTAETAGARIDDAAFPECFSELFEHYAAGAAWRVFPDVPEVLEALKRWGHRLAVASNFDRRLHRVLGDLGIADYFECIATSADARARKPAPDLLQHVMSRYGVAKEAACLVGDSPRDDAGAARAAGVAVFLIDRPRTTLVDFAEWLAESFSGK